ncbi:hypothetical protein [Rheinheimera nanhaiensis]|uniref:Uncharacterized protein n=1 Tax=Rheinheimera nanhaiensis E407-8 TaxID=562729 RepID=I1E204_9GAMM|nr:hypothetical protein [Rheinheimera nanhaiensis]GAB60332.1 hypothetical protein RNAN_3354 [Rheinheimera nanhaiensis E407-8]
MQRYQQDKDSIKNWLTAKETGQIIALIAASFNGVDSHDYFNRYFANPQHYQRRLRLFYQDEVLLGYCLLTFRKVANNSIVMGASAAFTPGYRGNNSTFGFSFFAAVSTWLRHPKHKVYYLDTMLSPAMYRAIGKKVAFIYPNPGMNSADINRYHALVPNAEPSTWHGLNCLKTVGRATNYSKDDIARLKASTKTEIAFYCQLNPKFDNGTALMVLIPVNLKQLLYTGIKWLKSLVKR